MAFHPVHAILAAHSLNRLWHAVRVYVTGAQDRTLPAHVAFEPTSPVEEALAAAEAIRGRDCAVVCIDTVAV